MSCIKVIPDWASDPEPDAGVTPRSVLESLVASFKPEPQTTGQSERTDYGDFDVHRFLSDHGIAYTEREASGKTLLELEVCPFCQKTEGNPAVIIQPGGMLLYKCQKDQCTDTYRWPDFRARYEPKRASRNTSSQSRDIDWDDPPERERPPLLWQTAEAILSATPEEVPWIVPGYVARGCVTELSAAIKAGKSTLITSMVKSMLDGGEFLNQSVERCENLVYLTEENPITFASLLRRAEIGGTRLHVLSRPKNPDVAWSAVMLETLSYCQQVGATGLIVDTRSAWVGLVGDAENDSGSALLAMKPLQQAAALGMFVVICTHDRKSGGDIGVSARGSNQWGGSADILVQLVRMNTPGNETRRELRAVSRLGEETPPMTVIELQDGRYISLGDTAQVERKQARHAILEVMPVGEENHINRKDLEETLTVTYPDTTFKRTTLTRALKDLEEENLLNVDRDHRPHRLWLNEIPPIEDAPGISINSTDTGSVPGKSKFQPPVPLEFPKDTTTEATSGAAPGISEIPAPIPIGGIRKEPVSETTNKSTVHIGHTPEQSITDNSHPNQLFSPLPLLDSRLAKNASVSSQDGDDIVEREF